MPLIADPTPRGPRMPAPFVLCPGSQETGMGRHWQQISTSGSASAVYPTSNLLIAYPFVLEAPATAKQLYCYNGTVVSGNVDMAILAANGDRLVSIGSTAQSGTSVLQVFNITDTALAPDTLYYCALACDNTTATFFRWTAGTAAIWRTAGVVTVGSSFAIPASNTLAVTATNYLPVMGIDFRGTI